VQAENPEAASSWSDVNQEMRSRVEAAATAGAEAADSLSEDDDSSDDTAIVVDDRHDQLQRADNHPFSDDDDDDDDGSVEDNAAGSSDGDRNVSMESVSDPEDEDESPSDDDAGTPPPLQPLPHRRQSALSPVVEGADELNVLSSDEEDGDAEELDDFDALMDEFADIPTGTTP
jgi:hypothetical protein